MYADVAVSNYIDNFIVENDKLITEIEQFLEVESHAVLFESFKDNIKTILNKAIEFFKRIKHGFDNFLLNLNYLKEAKVYVEMDKDIKSLIDMLDPSMNLKYIEVVNNCYNQLLNSDKDPYKHPVLRNSLDKYIPERMENGKYDISELETELGDIYTATDNIIDRIKNSKEFNRLSKNEYTGDTVIISTGILIEDIKICKDKIDLLTKLISKLSTKSSNNSVLNSGIISVIRKCIEYYSLRIDILNYYFKHAKYNLKMFKYNKNSTIQNNIPKLTAKITEIKPDQEICDMVKLMYDLNESGKFSDYINLHKQLCNKFNISEKSDIRFGYDIRKLSQNSKVNVQIILNDYKTVNIKNRTLYHHEYPRYSGDLPRDIIKPTAIGNNNTTLYPEPRIYFFMDLAFNKNGEIIDKARTEFSIGYLYKLHVADTIAYRDPIFINRISGSGSAAFIITTNPVHAEQISFGEYKTSYIKNFNN